MWTPELYFENLDHVDFGTMRQQRLGSAGIVEQWYKVYSAKEAGELKPLISLRMRVVGSFAKKFDLSHFPIDRQELSIRLRSHHPAHTLHLCQPRDQVKYMSICRRDNFVHDDEWHMASELVAYESRSHPTDTLNVPAKVYAEYQFRVKVARKWHVYVWDILMPLWLLSVFSTSSLIVQRSSLGERIAIPLAMILASLTFRNSFIERIPVVSYMTTLDKIILLNFLLFGGGLCAN
eukprot:2442612-Prymnesium_polylepis.1